MARRKAAPVDRVDGWQNVMLGLGTSRDKGMYAECLPTRLSQQQCEDLWLGDDMADKIVTALPGDALRSGVDISLSAIEDAEQRAAMLDTITAAVSDLGFEERLLQCLQYERAYGGSAIYVGAVDGRSPEQPLDAKAIRSIRHLTVFERRSLNATQYQDDPMEPDYGKPTMFDVVSWSGVGTGKKIHSSRLILFPGRRVTDRNPTENNGWGESILSLVYDVLRMFNSGWMGAGYTLHDFSVAIMKIKGLASILAANNPTAVATRAQAIEMGRSVSKTILIDADEDYERKTTTLTGLSDVLDQFAKRLSAAAGMPMTRLFGISAAGLNATGEGDARNWYDAVSDYQKSKVLPPYEHFLRLLFASKTGPTAGIEPENWSVKFPPLWQPTEQEQATTRKTVAETDAIYFDMGVVTSAEVRSSRFGGESYSAETVIDSTPSAVEALSLAAAPAATEAESETAQPTEETAAMRAPTIELTPTDLATIVTVNEARAQRGLPPRPDGNVTIAAFQASNAPTIAKAQEALDPNGKQAPTESSAP